MDTFTVRWISVPTRPMHVRPCGVCGRGFRGKPLHCRDHEMDSQYTHSSSCHSSCGERCTSYRQDFDVTHQPQAATSSYPSFTATGPHAIYQLPRQNIKVENIPYLVTHTPPVDVVSLPNLVTGRGFIIVFSTQVGTRSV